MKAPASLLETLMETLRRGVPGISAEEQGDKDRFTDLCTDLLNDCEKSPHFNGDRSGLFHALNIGMAQILKDTAGEDPGQQRYMAYFARGLLKAEVKKLGEKGEALQPWKGCEPLPEDRIMAGMATLVEEAKGKDSAHQAAIAVATADILKSIVELKKMQQPEKKTGQKSDVNERIFELEKFYDQNDGRKPSAPSSEPPSAPAMFAARTASVSAPMK